MNQEQAGQELPAPDRIPQRINEGMTVYDRDGEVVGTVQVIYFGAATEEAIERVLHSDEATDVEASENDATTFSANNVPEELRVRLMREGYILIKGPNLTGVKRYLRPEQIEGVFREEIDGVMTDVARLRVTRGELLNT